MVYIKYILEFCDVLFCLLLLECHDIGIFESLFASRVQITVVVDVVNCSFRCPNIAKDVFDRGLSFQTTGTAPYKKHCDSNCDTMSSTSESQAPDTARHEAGFAGPHDGYDVMWIHCHSTVHWSSQQPTV